MLELSSDEDEEEIKALYGPQALPGNGKGLVTAEQRKLIIAHTECSAATRKRDGWPCRMLTVWGPSQNLAKAKNMALAFITESQLRNAPEEDTPGAEDDPTSSQRTAPDPKSKAASRKRKRDNRKRREAEGNSQQPIAQPQQMMPMGFPPGMAMGCHPGLGFGPQPFGWGMMMPQQFGMGVGMGGGAMAFPMGMGMGMGGGAMATVKQEPRVMREPRVKQEVKQEPMKMKREQDFLRPTPELPPAKRFRSVAAEDDDLLEEIPIEVSRCTMVGYL
jgi:hypothetical protein